MAGGIADGLNRWVRCIVAAVLTVTFIEMVLPRSELKKYVDVVVGLALIGAILTPLLGLGVGIGAGLETATAAARGRPAQWGATSMETPAGLDTELASSIASRALEARVREALSSSCGSLADSWIVRVRVTDGGRLEAAEVDTGMHARSGGYDLHGPDGSSPVAVDRTTVDRTAVARTVASALECSVELVTVR